MKQYFPHEMPQNNGNKTDVRWLKVIFGNKTVRFSGMPNFNINIQDYSNEALNVTKTTNEMQRGDHVWLHIYFKQMGLGGDDSWSKRFHREYMLDKPEYYYSFGITYKGMFGDKVEKQIYSYF